MGVKDYQILFSNISTILLAINTILFLRSFLSQKRAFKIFSFYLIVMLIIQIKSYLIWTVKGSNLYLSHFYFILQFIFLSIFYYELFNKKKLKNSILVVSILVIIALVFQYIGNPLLYKKFNLLEIVLTSLTIVSFSVVHFYNTLTDKSNYIYVNSGIFIYLIGSTLIFCSGNFINDSSISFRNILWIINSLLYLVYQIFIFIEWYKNYRKT